MTVHSRENRPGPDAGTQTESARVPRHGGVVPAESPSSPARFRGAASRRAGAILALIAGVVLLYGVIYPNLFVMVASFESGGAFSLDNFRQVLAGHGSLEAALSSVILSTLTVALCALVGVPLAFLFERYDFPGRRLFAALAMLPLVLPPLVGTIAFIFLYGESGILARVVQSAFHLARTPWMLRGWWALLFFHTYTMYPFFYVFTGAGLRRVDAGLAEAARTLGATPSVVLRRITLPQLAPQLLAAALLTFMTAMASFSAPLFFGGNVRVLTLDIYNSRQRGDAGVALAETVILAAISLTSLLVFQRIGGTRRFAAAALKGAPRQRIPVRSARAVRLAMIAGIIFTALLSLPVLTLVLVSFARDGLWTTQTLPPSYTLGNYVRIFNGAAGGQAVVNSLVMSALAAVAALLWSFCVTAVVVTDKGRPALWRRAVSFLVLVPWALPGTVVAVATAEAYGRPNPLTGSFILVGTFWIVPVIYFLRFMPLVVRSVQASLEQMDPALEKAAQSLGATAWRRFFRVRLPLVWPGAIAGALLAFVIAMGEYVASVLVFVPSSRPLSIAIAAEMRDFNLGSAAAFGVILIALVSLSMVAAARLERSPGAAR